MSSPCKRLKLTPRKHHGVENQRFTQESKVTSTPHRSSGQVISPNISRIGSSGSSSRVKTRLAEVFHEDNIVPLLGENVRPSVEAFSLVKDFSETEASCGSAAASVATTEYSEKSNVVDENYDTYLNNLGKIKYTGNVWKQYKPLRDETLYAQLVKGPQNAQEIVTDLFLLYNRKPEDAICNLLEFCVNICGFQNFDISRHYYFRDGASKQIIKMMEGDNVLNEETVLQTSGRYLFMESERVHLAKVLKISVYNFLQKIIISGHERNVLYDEYFSKHFFMFVKDMSFSELRAIRHTGVIFAVKILTAIVMVYSKIVNDINYLSQNLNDTDERQIQKQDINSFLEFFYIIFIKNCRLQDIKVMLMRVECIHELSIWIRYFPKIFITQLQAVDYLIKLIPDMSRDVRYASLETCSRLARTPSVLPMLKNIIADFTETIGKRFYDVDTKVAVKAVGIFTEFLNLDESLITTHRFKLLMSLVFDKSFPIGEAAARFLILYLQKDEENEEIMLIQLAKFSKRPGDATKPLLIEGCLNHCPLLQNWDMYIRILLSDNVELYIKEALSEMLSESVHQTLTGKSTVTRDLSRKVHNVDPSQYVKIGNYLPEFNELLKKYKDDPNILIQFLKIFLLLDNEAFNNTYCPDVCDTMRILFYYHNDESLLNKLAETFRYLSNITSLSRHSRHNIEYMSAQFANELSDQLSQQSQSLLDTALKVKILFSHFNLTTFFKWETLFDAWGNVHELVTCSLVVCCKWYLLWYLRNITDVEHVSKIEMPNEIALCSRICKEFISTTFNMLQNLDGQPLHFIAYECLCDVHITYMKDLEHPVKMFKLLEQLKLKIDNQLQTLLVSFLDKYIISNVTMSLYDRRAHVVNYVNLVHHEVLPIECLAYVFKYYYCYYKEFGPIIESSLTSIAAAPDENVLLMLVIYTITIVYEDIVSKYSVMDIRTEEAKNLKLLVKQILTFKEFRSAKRSFKKLIYFSCKYSFKDESKYAFLYFVKYFVDLLIDNDDKKEVFDFFKKTIPKGSEKHDAVVFLADYMKNFKTPASKANKSNAKGAAKEKQKNRKPVKAKKVAPNKGTSKSENKISISQKAPAARTPRKSLNVSQETEISEDDLTIHDSESDDLDETFTELRI